MTTDTGVQSVKEEKAEEQTDMADATKIVYLTTQNSKFSNTDGNMLALQVEEQEHPVVYVHCSFPHTNRRNYLSIRTIDNKEIGIIKSLDDFPPDIVALLEKHLELRYFAPEISKVIGIKEEYGYSFWDTETTAGSCRFTVHSGRTNVRLVTEKKLLITDVDGNRFLIQDIEQLSDKEYRMVEMCM